jgi:PilZ domain
MEDSGERSAAEQRQYSRFRYIGVVFLSWTEPGGENHVMGRCLDISEGGLGVEVARRISVGTEVRVRADWVKLDGVATIRHSRERGGVFHVGLQLKQPLLPEILAKVVTPDSTTPPG